MAAPSQLGQSETKTALVQVGGDTSQNKFLCNLWSVVFDSAGTDVSSRMSFVTLCRHEYG